MKLYATVASERATKGQGGNEWLCINLTVHNGSNQSYPIGEIILDYNDDVKNHGMNQNEWVLKWLDHNKYDPKIIAQGHVKPKGKKQKGKCEHSFIDADNEGIYGKEKCRFCGITQDK